MTSYFNKIQTYSSLRFIVEVTILAFLSRFIIVFPTAFILLFLGINIGSPNIDSYDFQNDIVFLLFFITIIGPLIETVIFQLIPISLLHFLRLPTWFILIVITLIFAAAHLEDGLINFIGMIPIGFLFNYAFWVRKKHSVGKAFFEVFIIHGLTNLLAILMYLITS